MSINKYLVYQFFSTYTDRLTQKVSTNVWLVVATCTQEVDAQAQVQRIMDWGTADNLVMILPDSSPAPTAVPIVKPIAARRATAKGVA
jgi:hypothetical protein